MTSWLQDQHALGGRDKVTERVGVWLQFGV